MLTETERESRGSRTLYLAFRLVNDTRALGGLVLPGDGQGLHDPGQTVSSLLALGEGSGLDNKKATEWRVFPLRSRPEVT